MGVARILIIDDSTADVTLLRMALDQQNEKYELEVLTDGKEALRFVEEHRTGTKEPNPCVILLDLHLPQHDGLAVLRAARLDPRLSHIAIVILSGQASPADKEKISAMGGIYRQKPFKLAEFLELGAEIFGICKGESAPAS